MTYEEFWKPLAGQYDDGEAKATTRMVLDMEFGLSMTDILCDKVTQLSADESQKLKKIHERLMAGEPVQYVLGKEVFYGRTFLLTPDVLIPRPETAELCQWIISEFENPHSIPSPIRILDVGTGSGCIAITLTLEIANTQTWAWDISGNALHIAQRNAQLLGADISFKKCDVLSPENTSSQSHSSSPLQYDIIVSNPPYICPIEKGLMNKNVLEHEPHIALFVPEENPLLFYHAISQMASQCLSPHGMLYFEINPIYAQQLKEMITETGFEEVIIKKDIFGKQRFIKAVK